MGKVAVNAVTSKQFCEVTDRGVNFDGLDDARKRKLDSTSSSLASL